MFFVRETAIAVQEPEVLVPVHRGGGQADEEQQVGDEFPSPVQ